MRWGDRLTTGVLVAVIAHAEPSLAADFWERTHGRAKAAERETLESIFRAEAGTSDSIDELHVRVAIVDVARGKRYRQVLTLVYVLRTRRLLGLSSLPGELALLEAITQGEGPGEAVALAALELGRILRSSGDLPAARTEFDRALGRAWRSEARVEGYLMRGFLGVEEGDLERARADFLAALAFDLERPLLALTLEGLALVDLSRGDLPEARRLLKRAREIESGG